MLKEVKDAIHQLKTNKAVDNDGIAAELIQMDLHRLIVDMWKTELLPEERMEGIICLIHKKADDLQCDDFRAIIILTAGYKVLSWIFFRRLSL